MGGARELWHLPKLQGFLSHPFSLGREEDVPQALKRIPDSMLEYGVGAWKPCTPIPDLSLTVILFPLKFPRP